MRDLVITAAQIRRELRAFVMCCLAAVAINVFAIAYFKTAWLEILTMLPVTLALAVLFYGVFTMARIVRFLTLKVLRQKRL